MDLEFIKALSEVGKMNYALENCEPKYKEFVKALLTNKGCKFTRITYKANIDSKLSAKSAYKGRITRLCTLDTQGLVGVNYHRAEGVTPSENTGKETINKYLEFGSNGSLLFRVWTNEFAALPRYETYIDNKPISESEYKVIKDKEYKPSALKPRQGSQMQIWDLKLTNIVECKFMGKEYRFA